MNNRVRIRQVEILSDDWYILRKTTFDYQRCDNTWQTISRETYDRGNGATILLYNRAQQSVILTRQFRFPAFVNGYNDLLIEACAGLLDERDPITAIQHEVAEETGYRISNVQKVFEAFMSPGSVTEKLYFFVGEYQPKDKIAEGGGLVSDGEDIEVLEIAFADALNRIATGEIADGKTIMLLQHAALSGLLTSS
ncbi:MAG: NUDIX domain-containing protein [Chloroflexota bacterium]